MQRRRPPPTPRVVERIILVPKQTPRELRISFRIPGNPDPLDVIEELLDPPAARAPEVLT